MTRIDRTDRKRARFLSNIARASGLALALGGAAVFSSEAVAAGLQDEPRSVKVPYGDLNLERTEGAAVLYSRLKAAAVDVCRPLERRDPYLLVKWEQCFHKAMADAVAKVDNPTLTAYYRAKNPERSMAAVVTAKN